MRCASVNARTKETPILISITENNIIIRFFDLRQGKLSRRVASSRRLSRKKKKNELKKSTVFQQSRLQRYTCLASTSLISLSFSLTLLMIAQLQISKTKIPARTFWTRVARKVARQQPTNFQVARDVEYRARQCENFRSLSREKQVTYIGNGSL